MPYYSKIWIWYNFILEKVLKIKSYGQKVVFVLTILFFISFIAISLIFSYVKLDREFENIKIALDRAVNIKKQLLKKELKDIEDNAKILISNYYRKDYQVDYTLLKKFKIYGVYNNDNTLLIGRKLPFSIAEEDLKKYKYAVLGNYIFINIGNIYYLFTEKESIAYILDPRSSSITNYEPVFILSTNYKSYKSLICRSVQVEKSNFYITGCVDKNSVIHSKIYASLKENILIFSVFFIFSYVLYRYFFNFILLYPVSRLRKDIENMNRHGLERVSFNFHKYSNDEFAQISKVLEDTRKKILKHQHGMKLVLQTTSRMISMSNDIHKFSLFTINSFDELINSRGTVLCFYSKLEERCILKLHSDRYLRSSLSPEIEKKEFRKLKKHPSPNVTITEKKNGEFVISIKKDVNEEYSLFIIIFSQEDDLPGEDFNYLDMILSHLVYGINLLNLATYDPLTKLYNIGSIVKFAENEVERSIRYNHLFSIVLIDIDDFKAINDTYGHTIGDIILKQIAEILQSEVRDIDKVGRYGGEEFILVLPETSIENAVKLANRIKNRISEYVFSVENYKISVTVSAGVAGLEVHGKTFGEILQAADLALYQAKKKGKNLVVVLGKEEIDKILKEEFESKNFLEKAINEDNVIPHFQPIIDIKSRKVVGYEILARIKTENGIIPAYKFISTSIKFGIILKIDEIIQKKTVEKLSKMEKIPQMLFFNISRPYIQDLQHITNFVDLLDRNKIPKSNIILEITEEEAISEITIVKEAIRIARAHGIRFALDDFGVGYSTFSYIKLFDIDIIKLDGSLVKKINEDKDNQIIVGGIAYICKQKGIRLLAEMVETEEELETLEKLGVDYAQGYLFGKAEAEF